MNIEMRTRDLAFVHGQIDFIDTSLLDFKEFVEKTESGIEKYKYGYNYRRGSVVVFRYDNAPDPEARHLKFFPHHKHTKDGGIEVSRLVTFSEVIDEIQNLISNDWEF
ncbi:MAG: DUF6516 family protein [Thermodesulfobacteriota bacterium]|nr:DUF6516 family protein [Thermodesulfobacteriota bacterium]